MSKKQKIKTIEISDELLEPIWFDPALQGRTAHTVRHCNHPWHRRWLKYRVARYKALGREVPKGLKKLPKWINTKDGQSPREVHIQIFKDKRLEAEIHLRPCRWCMSNMMVGHFGFNKRFLYKKCEDLATYLFGNIKFKRLWAIDRQLRRIGNIRKLVRMCLVELGVPLIPIEDLDPIPDENTPLRYAQPPANLKSESLAG